jgi:peptidyl-prolyl cis-trans isomerase SDCCAG10
VRLQIGKPSNYVCAFQEPPTYGKVLLKTSKGDIDIELWTKETPKTCRNFIQLCMEGYYTDTVFHRVVKGFIVQGGDPNGDGSGGTSIYGEPFKDEFHSRLRFNRRGLVAMANAGKNDNGSQFFFTMNATPELQNLHTIFGKVTGDTVFNMLKLEDCVTDANERPEYPVKILKAEILSNPFEDIVPRATTNESTKEDRKKKREKGVKNFGLLSFGEEAEGDEEETTKFVQKTSGKAKSTHDLLNDPKLSKEVSMATSTATRDSGDEGQIEEAERDTKTAEEIQEIREKVKSKLKGKSKTDQERAAPPPPDQESSDEDYLDTLHAEKRMEKKKKAEEIRKEIESLKKDYHADKRQKNKEREVEEKKSSVTKDTDNEYKKDYITEQEKYAKLKEKLPPKGASREQFTLALLAKFKGRLTEAKECPAEAGDEEEDIQSDRWLQHEFHFAETTPVLAKDASTKGDDWYDAFDPRNPLNKRKRGEGSSTSSSKKKERK